MQVEVRARLLVVAARSTAEKQVHKYTIAHIHVVASAALLWPCLLSCALEQAVKLGDLKPADQSTWRYLLVFFLAEQLIH